MGRERFADQTPPLSRARRAGHQRPPGRLARHPEPDGSAAPPATSDPGGTWHIATAGPPIALPLHPIARASQRYPPSAQTRCRRRVSQPAKQQAPRRPPATGSSPAVVRPPSRSPVHARMKYRSHIGRASERDGDRRDDQTVLRELPERSGSSWRRRGCRPRSPTGWPIPTAAPSRRAAICLPPRRQRGWTG